MKVVITVGAPSDLAKVAPVMHAIDLHNLSILGLSTEHRDDGSADVIQAVLVHTGQQSEVASDVRPEDVKLPKPDVLLGVGCGTHAAQTGEIIKRFEEVLLCERPDAVVIVGYVDSALACALVSAKISFDGSGARPLVAHVGAGLRSFDRSRPEEINRTLTDHMSDVLFVTDDAARTNLLREGIPDERIHLAGDTSGEARLVAAKRIVDTLIRSGKARQVFQARSSTPHEEPALGRRKPAAAHQPGNDR